MKMETMTNMIESMNIYKLIQVGNLVNAFDKVHQIQ